MPVFKCLTHDIRMEVNRKSPDHGEERRATFNMGRTGIAPTHPCAMLLARTIAPGKMRLSDHLPGHVFGECEIVEVG